MCCKNKSLLVTEEEKIRILGLYGILAEEIIVDENGVKIHTKQVFEDSKYYKLKDSVVGELNQGLAQATEWIKANKEKLIGKFISVRIKAGESQLMNWDREQVPAISGVTTGYLSKQRYKTMKRFLGNYFDKQVSSGLITQEQYPVFDAFELVIGKSPVTEKKGPIPGNDYNSEQFVEIDLYIQSPEGCITGLGVHVMYNNVPSTDPKFGCRGGHSCDQAIFNVLLNGVSIGQANLNNAKDGASMNMGEDKKLIVTPEQAKEIISKSTNPKELVIALQCTSSNCHSSTAEVKITKKVGEGDSVLYHSCSPLLERNDNRTFEILVLDPCGNVIRMGKETGPKIDENANKKLVATGGYTYVTPEGYGQNTQGAVGDFIAENTKTGGFSRALNTTSMNDKDGNIVGPMMPYRIFTTGGAASVYGTNYSFDDGGGATNKQGPALVTDKGLRYTAKDKKIYMVSYLEPGTKISRILPYPAKNDNPPPNSTSPDILLDQTALGKPSPSGNYYITADTNNNYYWAKGKPAAVASEEDKKKQQEEANDKTQGIQRFKMDDESLAEFEKFFLTDHKVVKKIEDRLYEVVKTKMVYGGKEYGKGKQIRFVEA